MNIQLDTIIFYVKDIQLIRNFYVENFNLKVTEEDHIWILMNAGGQYRASQDRGSVSGQNSGWVSV
jgi:extradiol dioxygenase family protein